MLQETLELDAMAEDDLRRQYHELAELAGSLAHEIKNPLSVIHMNADLLSEELTESEWPGRRRAEAKSRHDSSAVPTYGEPTARFSAVCADA